MSREGVGQSGDRPFCEETLRRQSNENPKKHPPRSFVNLFAMKHTSPEAERSEVQGMISEKGDNRIAMHGADRLANLLPGMVPVIKGGLAELYGGTFRFLIYNGLKMYVFFDLCEYYVKKDMVICLKERVQKFKAIKCSQAEALFLNKLEPTFPKAVLNDTLIEESFAIHIASNPRVGKLFQPSSSSFSSICGPQRPEREQNISTNINMAYPLSNVEVQQVDKNVSGFSSDKSAFTNILHCPMFSAHASEYDPAGPNRVLEPNTEEGMCEELGPPVFHSCQDSMQDLPAPIVNILHPYSGSVSDSIPATESCMDNTVQRDTPLHAYPLNQSIPPTVLMKPTVYNNVNVEQNTEKELPETRTKPELDTEGNFNLGTS